MRELRDKVMEWRINDIERGRKGRKRRKVGGVV
jgi:hypothetical protein